jgi:cobalt/nickel transport system permease protein
MHIPDGYLSPSTCVALYAGVAPFWLVALKRARALLSARMVPLISLLAAFSFVLMMFNLPLPGGTTGHAVGMAISAIVLGPWASVLALSVALLIQAVFFGDGGITAFGANAFNMAVVGPLVAYAVYRLISGRSPIESKRRVYAAAAAGYVSINTAALCAAIEFGLQPGFFHDAAGAPLYAPYPLGIALPAMMIGHLSLAGLAELFISAGLVAWLQKANPSLLKLSAADAMASGEASEGVGWAALRPMWIGLAALMIVTPLGLLAAGTAWGEWGPDDFNKPQARQAIAAASREVAPPQNAPSGVERLSAIWTAPIPDYAPKFLKSQKLGYMLSAMFGSGLVILVCLGIDQLTKPGRKPAS